MKFVISRRDFMKMAGAAMVGAMAAPTVLGMDTSAGAADLKSGSGSIKYAGCQVPVLCETDVCVVGGGVAGVAAAVSAGKRGSHAVIVERGIALGGLQTLGCVVPCMKSYAPGSDTSFVAAVKEKLAEHGVLYDDKTEDSEVSIWTNPETMALIYDELCTEAGVDILYNMTFMDVVKAGSAVAYVIVQTIAGLCAIKAKVFIDASGDAILARAAGVPSERGFEKTGNNQPMSFRFEIGGIDMEKLYHHVKKVLKDPVSKAPYPHFEIAEARHRKKKFILEQFMMDGVAAGELAEEDAEYMQAYAIMNKKGTMSMNCPELPVKYSSTDPLSYSKGVTAGRQMIHRIANYLIKHMPGFENAYLNKEASMLGARESWRIKGKYYMEEADYHNRSKFPDAVARTAWYIDAHGEKVADLLPKGEYYEIPYRSMITNEVSNLIVAGRCISASFILQASMRIQVTCMSIGEAAGVAANWGRRHGQNVNEVRWDEIPEKDRSYVTSGK